MSVVKDCLYIQDDFSQFMSAQVTVFDCFVHTLLRDANQSSELTAPPWSSTEIKKPRDILLG